MQVLQFTSRLAIATALCAIGSVASAQEYRGTYAQQMACTGDVFQLCGQHIPDSGRITACLRSNVSRLSSGCRAVFAENSAVASRNERRGPRDLERQGPPTYERQGPPSYDRSYERQGPPAYGGEPRPYGQPYYERY